MDLTSVIKASRGISPAAITSGNATLTSSIIDRSGYESLDFLFLSGAITDGTFTITVYESDASDMTGETAVAAADLIGLTAGASTFTFVDTEDNTAKKVGYKGLKRYVRAKAVQSGATTGGFLTCIALQGHPRFAPVA
jgi:hypothetical protein